MAKQIATPAKGAGPETQLGPTPAPTQAYVNPSLAPRLFKGGYGQNNDTTPSSIAPGRTVSSPLADELRRVNAKGDGGDLLGRIIERGTTRGLAADVELQSPQTRTVDKTPLKTRDGMKAADVGGAPRGSVPANVGTSAAQPIRKPGA